MKRISIISAVLASSLVAAPASAKDLKAVGLTVGDITNPFFVQYYGQGHRRTPSRRSTRTPR